MAGYVIQATSTVEFEDGSSVRIQCESTNSIQRICTLPEINQTFGQKIY